MPGWPYRSLRVTGAMVVFTSGIVDDRMCSRCPSCCGWGGGCGCWLLAAQRWLGVGSSTLLGPEESGSLSLSGGGWFVSSGPPFASHAFLCVVVLVGLLFEICIVDASIFTIPRLGL